MDIISDMLCRIRNGLMARKNEVNVIYSKQNMGILEVLLEEGYISSYKENEIRSGIKEIIVGLKYYNGKPSIQEIKRVSKSSCRLYTSIRELVPVKNGLGISILSTSQGILSDVKAKSKNVGGEILCTVF